MLPSSSPSPIKGEGTLLLFQISISLAPLWERVRVRGHYFHPYLVRLKQHEGLPYKEILILSENI